MHKFLQFLALERQFIVSSGIFGNNDTVAAIQIGV